MTPENRLHELGIDLPAAPAPRGAYVPAKRSGEILVTAGFLPLEDGALPLTGRLGAEIELDEGRACARLALLNGLAAIRSALGSLDAVAEILRLEGFVASTPQFREQSQVLNAASELLVEIFGDAGRHARYAVGVAVLPGNAPVELGLMLRTRG